MPKLRTFPPKGNRPGNRFFATVIILGVLILIGIFLLEQQRAPSKEVRTAEVQAITQKPNPVSAPTPVFVMTKTNVPAEKQSNEISVLTATTQAVVPAVSIATNFVRTNVSMVPAFKPRPVESIFEAQLALARQGISSGSIDGVIGSQTRAALGAFQSREKLPVTGELDAATKARLVLTSEPYGEFRITTNEFAQLRPLGTSWSSKARQDLLGYETVLEMIAEKSCCSPRFLQRLNPTINWTNVLPETIVRVPLVERPKAKSAAAFVRISLSERNLKVFDATTNLMAHFPCSIARKVEKRPLGALYVENIAVDPDYTFNPANFPESAEARQLKTKLILSPGPNNPVGTVWIGLSKPGYGIHGTPKPEEVGRTESHGCFRLANWNAEHLVRLVAIGTPIIVQP